MVTQDTPQDKQEEIRVHKSMLEQKGDSYCSSKWGDKKINRALSFIYSFLDNNKEYSVLEIGVGGANLAGHLIKNKQLKLTGLDLVNDVLEKITKKRVNIPLVAADAEAMPFKDETFDIAIHNQTLHHFPSRKKVLSEIHRVLKKKGFLFSIEGNGWNPLVIYYHKAPWEKRKRFVSCNQTLFSCPKFKKEIKKANFAIKGVKMINFDFIKIPEWIEELLGKTPIINLFCAGSMVICSQKE